MEGKRQKAGNNEKPTKELVDGSTRSQNDSKKVNIAKCYNNCYRMFHFL